MRVTERAKAVAFIKSANKKKYDKLLATIWEQHSFKIDVYPKTLVDAYEILASHVTNNNTNNSKVKKENKPNNNNNNKHWKLKECHCKWVE